MYYFIRLSVFILLFFLLILNQRFFSPQKLKSSHENYRGNLINVPQLYKQPCSYTARHFGDCNFFEIKISPVYNPKSDLRYVSGYQPMIFGIPVYVAYERVGQEFKLLYKKWF